MRAALNRYADTVVYWYRRWRYRPVPIPRLGVDLPGLLPAWVVHLLAVACLVTLVAWPGVRTAVPGSIGLTLAGLVGLAATWRPGAAPTVAGVSLAGLFLLGSPAAPFDPIVFGLAGLAYAGYRLSLVAALLPWRGRVQWSVLTRWFDGAVLATTAAVAGLALVLTGRGPAWLALPGVVGLIGLAGLIGAGLRRGANSR